MDAKVEKSTSPMLEIIKWLIVVAVIAAAVIGNSYYGDQPPLYRALAVIALAAVATVIAIYTERGSAFVQLVKDARIEARKVVWPTRQETTQTTLIVGVVVVIMSLVLFGIDYVLSWLLSSIIGY